MKILIITAIHRISPRVALEAKSLSEEHEVLVLNWDRTGSQNSPSSEKNFKIDYIHLEAPEGTIGLVFYLPFFYWRVLNKIKGEDFDIIHGTHLFLLPITVLIGKKKKAKIVYDVYERHSITMSRYFPFRKLARSMIEWFEDKLVKYVNYVLTVDSPNGFLEGRYRENSPHVQVIYNVPSIKYQEQNFNSQYSKLPNQKNRGNIVYIGGLSKDKGVLMTMETMKVVQAIMPDSRLFLIGTFHDSENETKELIRRYGLNDHVNIIEWLPYNEMMEYLRLSQVGIALHQPHEKFLYVSKGTGRKFFTYMQASLPIVGPEFGEIGQVVHEEECGILVDTTDPQQIAEAIIYLLEHPDEAEAMGKRGRKAIEKKYNWEIEKEKLLEAYQKLERL